MVNPKGKKTISFLVRDTYEPKGKEVKQAVDSLLEAMWDMLSAKQQSQIEKKFEKEMEVLKW